VGELVFSQNPRFFLSAFSPHTRYTGMKRQNYSHPSGFPLAYHIVFTCYGTWLQGDARGSVTMRKNTFGTFRLASNPSRQLDHERRMTQPSYHLDEARRQVVMEAIIEVCAYRDWGLLALHVRPTHIHVVVSAPCKPEKVMSDFKAYASRALTRAGFESSDRKRWTRHGSTMYLWSDEQVASAVQYVVIEQGKPLQVYRRETL
jgi:REP element-mobilizing transposase RayT